MLYKGIPVETEEMQLEFAAKSARKPEVQQSIQPKDGFEWSSKDVVTSVKDQGGCGSCAAFSAMASIEACFNIKVCFL